MNLSSKNLKCLIAFCLLISVSGCASVYESSCHQLAAENRFKLSKMVAKAKKGSFKRHVILLETGNAVSNLCRSHFIDQSVFDGIPESLVNKCRAQGASSDKYCTLYKLDSKVVKQRIY